MKKILKVVLVLCFLILFSVGCSNATGSDSKVKLSFYSTVTSEADQKALDNVIDKFEEENPEIEIVKNYPGSEYESQLRVKMGANDMPDLFDTHGWAKNRYAEYTEDLSGMDWTVDLDPSLEKVLTDEDDKVYAFPLNQANDGLTYNENILKEYDIDPPETFDEFIEALEQIKEKGNGDVTPLWLAGSDKSDFGQFFDEFMTPLLITSNAHSYEEALLDGSFDWSNYTYLPEKLEEMQKKGLLNEDVLTAQDHEKEELMAQGKIGFVISTLPAESVKELNPDIELGIIPVPSIHEGDQPSWIGGERHTVAIWKDSEHKKEAREFIDFLAQPEIIKEMGEGTDLPTGLTNAEADIYYGEYYEKYDDILIEPYFDREYLPSGMWDVMGSTGQELLSGSMTPDQVSEKMREEYTRLLEE